MLFVLLGDATIEETSLLGLLGKPEAESWCHRVPELLSVAAI